ncbi:tetratricopeptide repeat-containing sulfotransferase family protein [Thalassotalea atypica]|uniref:tetratricopeptide repeat-containing sulfotransferase family protein n=1 Tax=Thalassotalea atypica TaxID=2054316 RepID=UPI002572F52F|nr:sulfotransferase [Thalassotalea atypica]
MDKTMQVEVNIDGERKTIELSQAIQLTRQKSRRYPQAAIDLANAILDQQPAILPLYHLLFALLNKHTQYVLLESSALQAISYFPNDGVSHFALAAAQRHARKPMQSLASLEKATVLMPEQIHWLLQLAIQYKERGDFSKALSLFNQCALHEQTMAEALYWRYNIDKKLRAVEVDTLVDRLHTQLSSPNHSAIHAAFCLYQYFEQQEDFESAWHYLEIANKLKHQQLKQQSAYSIEHELKEHHLIPKYFSQDLIAHSHRNKTCPSTSPSIFICGLPRSGTTLTEQILSAHSKICAGDELFALAQASADVLHEHSITANFPTWSTSLEGGQWQKIGKKYQHLTQPILNADEKAVWLTDKMPLNYKAIGIIRLALPSAKIIYCRRNPIDVLFGCFKQLLGDGNPYCYNLDELCDMIIAHHRVMMHWLTVCPEHIHVFDYEKLLANQTQLTDQLLKFIGIEWQQDCLDFHQNKRIVHTISNVQIRQPLSTSNNGAWRPYQAQLQPYIDKIKNAGIAY